MGGGSPGQNKEISSGFLQNLEAYLHENQEHIDEFDILPYWYCRIAFNLQKKPFSICEKTRIF